MQNDAAKIVNIPIRCILLSIYFFTPFLQGYTFYPQIAVNGT